ncbi:hypothetical protein TNCV_570821 [Trichonephila clavipes]|nr:hypothetical protein TNCV_570821 [Trichonephila clavipes]
MKPSTHYWYQGKMPGFSLSLSCDRSSSTAIARLAGSLVGKVSDWGWRVMGLSPVPLKTRREGQRCTLNLSRAPTSSRCMVW